MSKREAGFVVHRDGGTGTPDTSLASAMDAIDTSMEIATADSDSSHSSDHSDSKNHANKSTVMGASISFVNCIIGAGCIGFGGAMADSGGILSIVTMIFCAYLMKLSFDLLIELGLKTPCGINSSYESLGEASYGHKGRVLVLVSKGIFCFGGLIAIVVIVKDNFAPPVRHLLGIDETAVAAMIHNNSQDMSWMTWLFLDDRLSTFVLSAIVMLPLSLLRTMTILEPFSAVKIFSFVMILAIVVFLWATNKGIVQEEEMMDVTGSMNRFVKNWLEIRSGFIQNIGTYIFTFVAQHTCHLVYRSLKPELRNLKDWGKVSFNGLALSFVLAMPIGLFPYMTYWEKTTSNLFLLYPAGPAVDLARLLLCFTMLITYAPPFFSCRELIIISLPKHPQPATATVVDVDDVDHVHVEASPLLNNKPKKPLEIEIKEESPLLLPGEDRQLKQPYHVLLTVALWGVTVILALFAPSLGDVLNLVGCATGTIIAFILPSLFAFRIEGYSHTAMLLMVVGGIVGCIGTYYSVLDLIRDL